MTTQGYTCEQYVHVQFAVHFDKGKQPAKNLNADIWQVLTIWC